MERYLIIWFGLVLSGVGSNSGCSSPTFTASPYSQAPPEVVSVPLEPEATASAPIGIPVGVTALAPEEKAEPAKPNFEFKPNEKTREWDWIVLHHTASKKGSVESIHESHLKRKDKNGNSWLGIGYHFVIGNGAGMEDGNIEPTFRWRQQLHGAHAGNKEKNQHGIGIVLIGNFEEEPPTPRQVEAVKRLVNSLKQEYGIPSDKVIAHSDVKATACPGKFFPVSEIGLKKSLWRLSLNQQKQTLNTGNHSHLPQD